MKQLNKLVVGLMIFGLSCSYEDATFVQIIRSPEKFDGKEIEISGIYHEQVEDVAIYLSDDNETRKAMWVELSGSYDKLDRQRIRLKGTFDAKDKGHLGQYVGTIRDSKIVGD